MRCFHACTSLYNVQIRVSRLIFQAERFLAISINTAIGGLSWRCSSEVQYLPDRHVILVQALALKNYTAHLL